MVYKLSKTGQYHIQNNQENQDAVCDGKTERYAVISLADGVSTCKDAGRGAKVASQAITNLFLRKGDFFFDYDDRERAKIVNSHIFYKLKNIADQEHKDVREFSSTVASILYDKQKRCLLYFSLGDCIILGVTRRDCRILSMPVDSSAGCPVTTTEDAYLMTTTGVIKAEDLDSVVICSDGAWRQMYDKNRLKSKAHTLLACNDMKGLDTFLEEQGCFDDYSFISMDALNMRREVSA